MSQYKIERWDVVMFNNSLTKVPMIYIKPDITFLEFARNNNFSVACEISGTKTVYDGKIIPGVVDKSCYVPSCRPNFCEKTGLYVITLWSNWYGYPDPDNLGTVIFSGLKSAPDDSYKRSKSNTPVVSPTVTKSNKGMNKKDIFIVIGVLVALLVVVFIISKVLKKK